MDVRLFEIFYTPIYENGQRRHYFQRLKWLDYMAFLFSLSSMMFYIIQCQVENSNVFKGYVGQYETFDSFKTQDGIPDNQTLRNLFRIASIVLNVFVAILIYKRWQVHFCLQQWKNEVDRTVSLKNYRLFYQMLFEMIIILIALPPTVEISFQFYISSIETKYRLDQFISVLALFRTSFLFLRACMKASKFDDSKAYEVCVGVQCTSEQNIFTSKAENKDKHFYLLMPAIGILILVLSYGLRECEISNTTYNVQVYIHQDTNIIQQITQVIDSASSQQTQLYWNNYAYPIWVEAATLTTVGYGDAVPKTLIGRIFVVICCLLGPAIISFSIISLVNFSQFTHSESLLYEAITLGEKQIQLQQLAATVIFFSRKNNKNSQDDPQSYNKLKVSLIEFKRIKKDIANQQKYPPIENLVIKFCQSAVTVVKNIQLSTLQFSTYITILSNIETLQEQINIKIDKLIKDMREKELELQEINSKDYSYVSSYQNNDLQKGLSLQQLHNDLKIQMSPEQYSAFMVLLNQVSTTKSIQQGGGIKKNIKKVSVRTKPIAEMGYNLIKYKLQQSTNDSTFGDFSVIKTEQETTLTENNASKRYSPERYSPGQKHQISKIDIDDILDQYIKPKQTTILKQVSFLGKRDSFDDEVQTKSSGVLIIDKLQSVIGQRDLNKILSNSFEQYDTITHYFHRYIAIKSSHLMDQQNKSYKQENFLIEQLELISNMVSFKQDFIFKLAEFSDPQKRLFLITQIRQNNPLVQVIVSEQVFGLYFQNNNLEIFHTDNHQISLKLKQIDYVQFCDNQYQLYVLSDVIYTQSMHSRKNLKITFFQQQKQRQSFNNQNEKFEAISVQLQQREEVEVISVVQDRKNIGILDSEGFYYHTNAAQNIKLLNIRSSQSILLNPTVYYLSFKVKTVVCGQGFVIFLTQVGKVYSQGQNDKGQLGLSDNNQRSACVLVNQIASQNIVQITCGIAHCLALAHDGQLFSWGDGSFGQLLPGKILQGGGKVLPVMFQDKFPILQIQCGQYSSSILNGDFQIVKWGQNSKNQTSRVKSYQMVIINHQISWSLEQESITYTCFRLPKNEQLAISLKKNLRKAAYKVASKCGIAISYETFNSIERTSKEFEYDQNYTKN